ncbi:MAG TPA: lysozyme [Gammaproteobacteria bacterium]|jgi:lysozyme|nr:lysozyme [Gammaproteobacteria bacterium]
MLTILPSTLQKLIDRIKIEEGFRSHAYKDTSGILTIGYGHNLEAKGISSAAANFILIEDINYAENYLINTYPIYLKQSDVRKAVLIDMAFNLGMKLVSFQMFWRYLAAEMYAEAAKEMLESLWAKEVGNRAQILSFMMRENSWPSL